MKDKEAVKKSFLNMYARPVINKEQLKLAYEAPVYPFIYTGGY
jgi:hypothetical protein